MTTIKQIYLNHITMKNDWNQKNISNDRYKHTMRSKNVIESLVSGSLSSTFTTILYQPLELLKTRIQLQRDQPFSSSNYKILGRTTQSATRLIRDHSISYLWRGTGASLLRSVPGVGLYYASLNVLQTKFSEQHHKPDSATQAFYFGLTSRSMISFLLLPITVVKVRYESGQYKYPSLSIALSEAYLKSGWVGVAPTILRDSLFSGIYYMCFTKLKSYNVTRDSFLISFVTKEDNQTLEKPIHSLNFVYGIISGLFASAATNPLDVLKTNIQVNQIGKKSMTQTATIILREKHGYIRFFDGLVPRSLRRTLIAASTWTFYEFFMDSFSKRLIISNCDR